MDPFVLTTEEKAKEHVVLIVDKEGWLGSVLAKKIRTSSTVILVSPQKPDMQDIIHVPFSKRVPEIPEGVYSQIFYIAQSENQTDQELLVPLAQKASADSATFVVVLAYQLYKNAIKEELEKLSKKWVIVLIGDVFDSKIQIMQMGEIFQQAKARHTISLSGLGLETIRPVALADVLNGILRVAFGSQKEHICFAFPKHPYTTLSVVHALQKIDPLLKIDFTNDSEVTTAPMLPEGVYLFPNDYDVAKRIQDSYSAMSIKGADMQVSKKSLEGKSQIFTPIIQPNQKKHAGNRAVVVSLIIGTLLFVSLPLLWTGLLASIASGFLSLAKNQAEVGNISQAQTYASASTVLFGWARGGSDLLVMEASVVGRSKDAVSFQNTLVAGEQLSEIVGLTLEGAKDFKEVATNAPLSPLATFNQGTNAIKNALIILESLHTNYLPGNVAHMLTDLQPEIHILAQTIDISSHIFGFDRPKTYLVLFQNNTELRPGGGFIGSYALVKINKGKVTDFAIHDVYDADGQLQGHVEPPFAIRRYIPLVHWYLRDSNFSADFQKNAQNAAFFLQQETGEVSDGVIALDLSFVQAIVKVLGKVYVPQYSQTVTNDNFFLLVESHAEKNSFAGSTQKKDFLASLFTAIQTQLTSSHISYLTLIQEAIAAVGEKHLMLAFADPSIQQVFTINGFSPSLWDGRSVLGNRLNDFTGINEANLGVDKVNAYIKRQVAQIVTISPTGSISANIKITYQNTSDGTWPGGAYKNYLRMIVPNGTNIANISFNNKPQNRYPAVIDPKVYEAPGFKAPNGVEIEQAQEGGKTLYGFLVQVPIQSIFTVDFSYTLSQKVDLTQPEFTYDELLSKQPGTDAYPYSFSLTYPTVLQLLKTPSGVVKSGQEVHIGEGLTTDKDYVFTFVKSL